MSAEQEPNQSKNRQIHICPDDNCGSELVQAVEYSQTDTQGVWRIDLRCPECDSYWSDTCNESELYDFEDNLDAGEAELEEALEVMQKDNMEDMEIYAGRFTAALNAEQILPEDFGRPKA